MKRDLVAGVRIAAIVIGWIAATLAGTSAAMADPNCNEFFSNSDGSWSPSHPIVIGGPTSQTQIGPSAAHLKFLHCKRQTLFQELQMESGARTTSC